jgi:PAS domain S-box-containing protein
MDESELRRILDALPEPAVVHQRGQILTANRAFAALLGVDTVDELVGLGALEFVHPDDRGFVLARLSSTRENRRTPEHRLLNRKGEVIPVEVTGIPFPFGDTLAALAVVHDLRERKRLDAELAAAERLASLGRLAAAVGHEINNPLMYVLTSLELLRRELGTLGGGPELDRLLGRVQDAHDGAVRVRDIVRDLKTLSNPYEGPIGAIDVHRVLDVAAATAMHEIEHRAVLVRDLGDIARVAGSEGRLVQVFVNLLVNAAHAISDGDVAANEIRIVTRMADDTHVCVEIHDTGVGFTPDDAMRMFEPYFTTKVGGIGLGLSIAHRIVSGFGGKLVAEPRAPRGSCFRVTLLASPLAPVVATAEPAHTPGKRGRVLFADDEASIRKIAADALAPHEVVTAASGRAVIELLEREHFDAIICDLQMPDLGGVDVYEWLVASRPALVERLVLMTGGVFTERARRLVSSLRYVEKPLDVERMREIVQTLINL